MANRTYSLKFEYSRPWVASSNADLLKLLREEARVWGRFPAATGLVRLGYENFSVDLDQFQGVEPDTFYPEQVRNFLPPSTSNTGALFFKALEHGDTGQFQNLVFAFFVSNGWVASPFVTQSTIQGSNFRHPDAFDKYLNGLALLAGAHVKSDDLDLSALYASSDHAKSQLASLKADMTRKSKLLQANLVKARQEVSGLRDDREQIRAIAVSGSRIAEKRFETDRERWNRKFSDVHEKFTKQLEYKSAVELWGTRATSHKENADKTRRWLVGSGISFIVAIAIFVGLFGDEVAKSFVLRTCDELGACTENWSAKGPLTIGSILLVSSLILWFLRTLNKFYLSARHLASDAEERKAFAQTFLAFREDKAVDQEHEAIVLAALFRPTQDGVVADEVSPLDPSVVSLLSRRLSG